MRKVIDGPIGDELLKEITDNPKSGLIGLAWMDCGARTFYNKQKRHQDGRRPQGSQDSA